MDSKEIPENHHHLQVKINKRDDLLLIYLFITVILGLLFQRYPEESDSVFYFILTDYGWPKYWYVHSLFEKINQCIFILLIYISIINPLPASNFSRYTIIMYFVYYLRDPILFILIANQYPKIIDIICLLIMLIFVIIRFKQNN